MTKLVKAMDLGCLDLGCLDVDKKVVDSEGKEDVDAISESSTSSSSKVGKNKSPKSTSPSALNALNRFTSQIKKPPHRKSSPLNWFPRKKVDSYLKRKIKMLQEGSGMNLTLDETLGDANPHYCRVLREKMAAREAANKAMEARKAALVEASWCRILQAARIPSKEAEMALSEAEKKAGEAFESATAMGVIMYDMPNCALTTCQVETSSSNKEGSTTHTVTASFETAFEVDRQVATAVKIAFSRLANCPCFDKDEFKGLLRTISENPDTGDTGQELSELSSECESESGLKSKVAPENDGFEDMDCDNSNIKMKQKKSKRRKSLEKFNPENLVEIMLERLKHLKEEELSSLATIVATCGLNAALAEVENTKLPNVNAAAGYPPVSALNVPRRISLIGGASRKSNLQSFMGGPAGMKKVDAELPSLDKFLVKRMTKLEREVQEARSRRNESGAVAEDALDVTDKVDDSMSMSETIPLESILLKHSSKLEKEVEEAKMNPVELKKMVGLSDQKKDDCPHLPSLDKFLVKHVSRLEREVEEAKNRKIQQVGKENVDTTRDFDKRNLTTSPEDSLEKILIKPVHRLEREKTQALSSVSDYGGRKHQLKQGGTGVADCESLDKVLVKHVSRLEKEKTTYAAGEKPMKAVKRINNEVPQTNEGSDGLDQILVKHKSRLEREKGAAVEEESNQTKLSVVRKQERERELQEAWGGLSFGNSIRPHVSKLEREKAAWIKAEEETRQAKLSVGRKQQRERELQEAWGGLSFGNSIRPHVSKLERDKAAWIKAEEEERRQAMKT